MTISVVIPTLDEAPCIVETVESVFESAASERSDTTEAGAARGTDTAIEVIVVDGGSRDETCRLAREAGARVLEMADSAEGVHRGRAHQLRLGSEKSKGEAILFLHADTSLPGGWSGEVLRALSDPRCAGGAFAFRFTERGGRERWIEFWVGLRVTLLGLPYGDQALFMRRSVLEGMGGVPRVRIMEDLDLVRGIKRAGRLVRLPLAVRTSSRRYRERGTLRTIFWHQVALLGWFLGWDRERLASRMGR